jgi:hypothetical protein
MTLVWTTMGAAAWASSVPPAVYSLSAWNGGAFGPIVIYHAPGEATAPTGESTVSSSPSGQIDVSAYLDATHTFFNGSGRIDYYFEFSGPDGSIPVAIDAHVLETASDFLQASASLSIEGVDQLCVGPSISCPSGELTQTLRETLSANTVYHVTLSASVFGSGYTGTAHALVDPVIYLDPSFAGDPSQYTYAQSEGVGNSASTAPEPGTFGAGALILAALVAKRFKLARRGGHLGSRRVGRGV